MSAHYVCVEGAPIEPAWAVLVPASVAAVTAALDSVLRTPEDDGSDESPLEIWRGTGDYTAIAGPFPERGTVDITLPTELARAISRKLPGTIYAVLDEEGFEDICFAYAGGCSVEAGPRRTAGPHAFAAELGCDFRPAPAPAYEPPGGASMIVVEGCLPEGLDLPVDVISQEVSRERKVLTLAWYTESHLAFTSGEIESVSRQMGDRTVYWFASTSERPSTEGLTYEELAGGISSRFGDGVDAEAVMRELGLDWSDLYPGRE